MAVPVPVSAVYLLVGLTGSGKTTYAERRLVPTGAVRLSVDELVFERYGRYGVDYPEDTYPERESPVVAELHARLAELLSAGQDTVWDHGLWLRKDRDALKESVVAGGGRWRLLYFPLERAELLRRLDRRNRRGDANALTVTPKALDEFIARFEAPHGEGEEIVQPGSF